MTEATSTGDQIDLLTKPVNVGVEAEPRPVLGG